MNNRIVLIYKGLQLTDRWFKGDHFWRTPIRRILRGPDRVGGIDRVYLNLCAGLDLLGIEYVVNPKMSEIRSSDWVGVIGRGRSCLDRYTALNPIVTGIAVAYHPAEWPTLFEDYRVIYNVVHSNWVKEIYTKWYGESRIKIWAAGIDTTLWKPIIKKEIKFDFLVYEKIMWEKDRTVRAVVNPILQYLNERNLTYKVIHYGTYEPKELLDLLQSSRGFIFLSEHESQGLAYQQAMSAGLPILAWDQGLWLDPCRFEYGDAIVHASSVPFFDERCGLTFRSFRDFPAALDLFIDKINSGDFFPRDYILENLTLTKTAENYLNILKYANS